MGVAQSVTVTGTAMFPHKSLLFVCTLALATANPQSYFHNFGKQGTYTSVSHGSAAQVHQPAPAYKQAAPTYSHPAPSYRQPAYHAPVQAPAPVPAPTLKIYYHAPVAKPAAYHAPLPKPYVHHHQTRPSYHQPPPYSPPQPHGPGIEYDREKCSIDYVEKKAEVCVPTFKTDCEKEDVKNGLVIKQEEECYQVTKTICTETEEIVDNEVCAYSFTLVPVETEAKLVDVKWEKSCVEDTTCVNPHHAVGGYAAPPTVWRSTGTSATCPPYSTLSLRRSSSSCPSLWRLALTNKYCFLVWSVIGYMREGACWPPGLTLAQPSSWTSAP